jgi:hypothetical protein
LIFLSFGGDFLTFLQVIEVQISSKIKKKMTEKLEALR